LGDLARLSDRWAVQTAVYWGNPQPDGYGGTDYDSPIEISVRWEEKPRRVTDSNGKEIVSRAEVLVTQDVVAEGLLYLGALSDLTSSEESNPETVEAAYKIRRFDKSPLPGETDQFIRIAYL